MKKIDPERKLAAKDRALLAFMLRRIIRPLAFVAACREADARYPNLHLQNPPHSV